MKSALVFILIVFNAFSVFSQHHPVYQATPIYPAQNQLGEGAFWDSKRKKLWFIDIEKGELHSYVPKFRTHGLRKLGQKIGTVVPADSGTQLIMGLEDGIYTINSSNARPKQVSLIPELKKPARLNDGKCDPQGRFWVGGLHPTETGTSHLYRYDGNGVSGKTSSILDSVSISNGICWSEDGKTMYYIDTPTRKVKVFDFDGKNGTISNGRICIQIPDSLGWPDGMTIDVKGNLWIGMWGGSCVTNWSPSGKLLGVVKVAALNVTSCAFGGPNFDQLYITTARQGMTDEQLQQYPLSGDLFIAKTNVKGKQMPYWKAR